MCINTLKLQDLDSRMPCSECLDRLEKIWGRNLLEFSLRKLSYLHAEKEYWHRLSLCDFCDCPKACGLSRML